VLSLLSETFGTVNPIGLDLDTFTMLDTGHFSWIWRSPAVTPGTAPTKRKTPEIP